MTKDLVVGLLFLTGLLALGYTTILIKGLPTGEVHYPLAITFDRIAGLRLGDQVRVRGFTVGEVTRLSYRADLGAIEAAVVLDQEIPPRTDYRFMVRSASALGGTYIDYEPGFGDVADQGKLSGSSRDLLAELEKIVGDNQESVSVLLKNLENLSRQAAEGDGLVQLLLSDTQVAEDFRAGIASIREVADRIAEGLANDDSILGALLRDSELTDGVRHSVRDFEQIAADTRAIVAEIRSGNGALGKLIMDAETGEGLTNVISNVETAAENFNQLMTEVRSGDGVLAAIINNKDWSDKFLSTLTNIEEISRKLNDGDGAFARLLNDPSLIEEATRLLTLLRESTEDLREQAPISSFVNVLFSAF
ncbi:MAG: MlaD family protein [Planctomycetota bacterium]